MPKNSAFELLSPELQQHILMHIETLETLHSLICASPRLYQVFRLNKETILSTIALRQFHPAVQSEAVAVAKLEQLQDQPKRDTAVGFCDKFPCQIHGWCGSNASGPLTIDLCQLDRTVKFFIYDYAQNTLPILDQLGQSKDLKILPEYRPYDHLPPPNFSYTEIGRLQRAFCRFELYRRLFGRCSHDLHLGVHKCLRDPPLTTAEQAKLFLQDLPAYQITEIACIRDYLFRRLRGIYDALETELVQMLPIEAMTFDENDESSIWESPFFVFTNKAQHQQEDHLEHLMSLGLPYVRRIFESTGDERRDLFIHRVRRYSLHHLEHDFLSKALECLGLNPEGGIRDHNAYANMNKAFAPACDEKGYSELPQGWLWGNYSYPPYKLIDRVHKGLRDWGYVFWDYDRLRDSGILRRDPHNVRMIRFSDYEGRNKPSVEQRLHALYPSATKPRPESDDKDQSTDYDGHASVSSLDEVEDWEEGAVILDDD